MYYQNYEDYMRCILGYPVQTNTYNYSNVAPVQYEYIGLEPITDEEINDMYPEIYKLLNPMVCKICEANTKPITRELLEQMTDEIYLNIESDTTENVVNIRVEAQNNSNDKEANRQQSSNELLRRAKEDREERIDTVRDSRSQRNNSKVEKNSNIRDLRTEKALIEESKIQGSSNENRQIRRHNNILRDLIKILILNRLFGRNRPRPPFPGRPGPNPRPPRPPFPGGPNPRPPFPPTGGGQGGPRPPIEPRYVM